MSKRKAAGIGQICMSKPTWFDSRSAMLMAMTDLSPSLIYPVVSVGGLAVVTIFSLFVFKEKMYPKQWFGVAIGAVAVVLLSI